MKENMDHLTPIKKIIKTTNAYHCYTGSISASIEEEKFDEMNLYLSKLLLHIVADKKTGCIASPIDQIVKYLNFGFLAGGFIATRQNALKLYHSLDTEMNQYDEYLEGFEEKLKNTIINIRLIMMKICFTNYLNGIDILCEEINKLKTIDFIITKYMNKCLTC